MNTVLEHFRDGGYGMFPTLAFGLLLLAVAVRYAMNPERRIVPLLAALNLLTLSAGALGFVSGVITTARCLGELGDAKVPLVAIQGIGEALHNVAFALIFVVLGAIAITLGAWKIARDGAPVQAR